MALLLSALTLQAESYALIIGISEFKETQGSLKGVARADADAQAMAAILGKRGVKVDLLLNRDAKAEDIRVRLEAARGKYNLNADSDVYIFLSGRGVTPPENNGGVLMAYDTPAQKAATAGVAIELILSKLAVNDVRPFLFADLRRSPPELEQANSILIKLQETVIRRPRMSGLVAQKNDPEKAKEILPRELTGAFTTALLQEWEAGERDGGLAARMAKRVLVIPLGITKLGDYRPRPPKTGVFSTPPSPPSFGLLASMRFFSNGLGERMRLHREFTGAMAKGKLTLAMALFQQLQERVGPEAVEKDAEVLATAMEGQAQRLITKYGIGDQFPSDVFWKQAQTKQEDYEKAAKLFGDAAALRPSDRTLIGRKRYMEGLALAVQERPESWEKARLTFFSAEADLGQHPELYDSIGVASLEGRRYAAAEHYLTEAKKAAPNWAFPRHNLALLWTEQGKYQKAEQEYRDAIRVTPFYPYLHHNLGVLLQRLRRDGEAEKSYKEAVKLFAFYEEKFRERAANDEKAKAVEDEKEAREKADALHRNAAESLNALATAREAKGRKRAAIDLYRQAVERNRENPTPVHNLAGLLMEESRKKKDAGMRAEALERYRANMEKFPPSRLELARALAEDPARLGEAETVIRGADPKSREAAVLHARILIGLKQEDRALTRLAGFDGGDVFELRGDAAKLSGDEAGACAEYENVWKAGIRNKSLEAKFKGCRKRR